MKGVTIFLVVFGHCIQYGNKPEFFGEATFFDDIIFRIIYSFHMPLFALVSGYLFYSSSREKTFFESIKKQFSALIIPVISWWLLDKTLYMIRSGSFYEIFTLRNLLSVTSHLWFLWSMFWCSLSVIVCKKFFRDKLIFHFIIFAFGLIMPNLFGAALHLFMYPYFIAGYYWHREHLDEKIKSLSLITKFLVSAAIIIIWCIMIGFFKHDDYIYTTGITIYRVRRKILIPGQFTIDMFRWAIGFMGCMSVMILLKFLRPLKIITSLGNKTLGIYTISSYFISRVVTKMTVGGYLINFIEAVIISALCYVLSCLISKNRILNKFLLGGR